MDHTNRPDGVPEKRQGLEDRGRDPKSSLPQSEGSYTSRSEQAQHSSSGSFPPWLSQAAQGPDLESGRPTENPNRENVGGGPGSVSGTAEMEDQNRALRASVSALETANQELRTKLRANREKQSSLADRLATSKESLGEMRERRDTALERAKDSQNRLKESREKYAEARDKLSTSLKTTREKLANTSDLWRQAGRYYPLFWQGLLADEIAKSDFDLGADAYLCLLPSTVPAALDLRRKYGGRIICDCVENVEVERHSLAPNLHPPTLDMINLGAYGALTRVDGIMTVSNAVKKTLHRYDRPVRLQPNYRRYEEVTPSGDLRKKFDLDASAKVMVASGGIVNGFEAVVDALERLPSDVHLVAFVRLSPSSYDAQIREYISAKGLESRVHLHEFVPYDELAPLLADADLGLIVLDPLNPNHSVSLPNRVFDFTTAGLPFVAPAIPEIAGFVEEYQCGVTISEVTAEGWLAGIESLLANREAHQRAIVRARENATWESLDDGLVEFLGNPRSVTLLGFRDLSRYQRFLRVTDSLTQRGIRVKAAFFSRDPAPIKNRDAEFFHFSERYGRGPGLASVPYEYDPDAGDPLPPSHA